VDCALISKRATDARKEELFDRLADHLAMLASELERAIEAKGPQWLTSLVQVKPRPRPCGFTAANWPNHEAMNLFVRKENHPPASDNYRVVVRDGGDEIEVGSIGV
jgi:hypothetical protein